MTDAQHESLIITGLKNAHAMENQALAIMKPQVSRIENYPEVARRLEQHITETDGQIARLEELLEGFGAQSSGLKDAALSFTGSMAAMGHTMAGDEILKNSYANFAFENFEIAAYKSLLILAELGGHGPVTAALLANLKEEQAMAVWLDENLPAVTTRFASLKENGQTAKV
jgi:ferritin-like metal-binding protein YciE